MSEKKRGNSEKPKEKIKQALKDADVKSTYTIILELSKRT